MHHTGQQQQAFSTGLGAIAPDRGWYDHDDQRYPTRNPALVPIRTVCYFQDGAPAIAASLTPVPAVVIPPTLMLTLNVTLSWTLTLAEAPTLTLTLTTEGELDAIAVARACDWS